MILGNKKFRFVVAMVLVFVVASAFLLSVGVRGVGAVDPVYTIKNTTDPIVQTPEKIAAANATYNALPKGGEQPAGSSDVVGWLVGFIMYLLIASLGAIMDLCISLMIFVAKYNDITNQPAVIMGWKAIRDVCNNFFIIILMVIAVGTILRVESYKYNKLLSKLLIMAVLINFSMMFAGIMIDFSQILTLSFAAKISDQGKSILLGVIGLPSGLALDSNPELKTLQEGATGVGPIDLIAALLVLLIVSVVSIVVILIVTLILAFRIVMFWFLVILSPIAFFGASFPKGQEYASRWWKEMGKYLVVGPVMLFFLYISFTVMVTLGTSTTQGTLPGTSGLTDLDKVAADAKYKDGAEYKGAVSGMATPKRLFNILIALGLLIGTLVVAQESGVAGAKMAGKGLSTLKSVGKGAAMKYTGAGFVKDTAQQYLKNRKAVKQAAYEDKVNRAAGGVASVMSGAKKVVTAPLRATWDAAIGKKGLEKKQQEFTEVDNKLNDEKAQAVKKHEDFKDAKGNDYKYDKNNESWTASNATTGFTRGGMDDKQLQRMVTSGHLEDISTTVAGQKIENTAFTYEKGTGGKWTRKDNANPSSALVDIEEDDVMRDLGGVDDDDLAQKKKVKESAESRAKWVKRGGVALAGAAAGALSFIAPGAAGIGLGTALTGLGLAGAGAMTASNMGNKIGNAGNDDLKAFGKYRTQKVSDARDAAKQADNNTVLATMDDQSKDKFTRAASTMEAMSRGLLTLDKAQEKRTELETQFKKTGDKGLVAQLKQVMEKNYVGGTQVFQDAKINTNDKAKYKDEPARLAAQRKKESAQREIRQGFEDGSYKIKDMDTGSLESVVPSAAAGLSVSSFLSQYKDKDVSDSKRAVIKQALEKDTSHPSRHKLAHLSGIKGVWKNMATDANDKAQAGEFMKTLSLEDIEGLLKKKPDGLKEAARGDGGIYNLSPDVKMALNSDTENPINKSIRKVLNLPITGEIK